MIWLLLQAAQPAPDVELEVRVDAQEVRTEVGGRTSLTVRAEPDGGSSERTDRAPPSVSAAQARNVRVVTRAQARIADPAARPVAAQAPDTEKPPETPEPDRR